MAVSHAVFIWNHAPDPSTGLSPADLFTRTRWPQSRFHDLHVWGCPVYVLNKTISDGKKIPRWKPRSQRMVYMGRSPTHASSVPLVLNPATGSIIPQFHVVFDDWFATVPSDEAELPDFTSPTWSKIFGESRFQYYFDDDHDTVTTDSAIINAQAAETSASTSDLVETAMQSTPLHSTVPLPVPPSIPATLPPSSSLVPTTSSLRGNNDESQNSNGESQKSSSGHSPIQRENTMKSSTTTPSIIQR